MKGDFSRNTFNPQHQFTRVLMQQGRVQLDADWNEQASILLHYLRSLAANVIGPHGGPVGNLGFKISNRADAGDDDVPLEDNTFYIWPGHYYVDGLLCVNSAVHLYTEQIACPEAEALDDNDSYLVYLHAWERHLTHLQTDAHPPIREVALNGPDTATRAQLVCQVKVLNSYGEGASEVNITAPANQTAAQQAGDDWRDHVQGEWDKRGMMIARLAGGNNEDDVCVVSPDSRYRGLENHLYRVEVHDGGAPEDATFKFSRENGSTIFPLKSAVNGNIISLEHLGRDARFGLQNGDWVEVVDDDYMLCRKANRLLEVEAVDPVERTVTLSGTPEAGSDLKKHPILRRWDQKNGDPTEGGLALSADGVAAIAGGDCSEGSWLNLEDGIQVCFPAGDEEPIFRTGDYWLIPARTATGRIEWPLTDPRDPESPPLALPPHGIQHHFAPLAIITLVNGTLAGSDIFSCQRQFIEFVEPAA